MKYSFKLGQLNSAVNISKILDLKSSDLAEKLNSQIGAFDEIIDWGVRYKNIYVVRIVKIQKHPDADKLNICLIDDGGVVSDVKRDDEGLIQVVCGAPNAKDGLTVVWAAPGATVPSTFDDREPFVLSKIKLRGVESNGMLASAKELAIGSDHDGILDLSLDITLDKKLLKPGTEFIKLYDLDDIIVDFENKMFTHRPDCFGHLGISREIAGIQKMNFKSPDWYKDLNLNQPQTGSKLEIKVTNKISDLVPRYTAICLENIKVEPSPIWLQSYLTRVGIRPVNNIVDVTNYLMILTGQPLHAFDYDKLKDKSGKVEILVRNAKSKEKIKILNGKEVELTDSDIVITNGDIPVAIAGVMGGVNSEVDQNTKNIVIESATFDMYAIRRTSMRHGIFTDAVTRYTKGQPAYQTLPALLKAVNIIKEFNPSVKVGRVIDEYPNKFEYNHLTIEVSKINKILGLELSREQVSKILNYVEIDSHEMLDEVCVTPPFWRTDLKIDEDIIEEVGRLYGFNKISAQLPIRRIAPARKNPMIELKRSIRSNLSSHGANEVLTYNFVNESLLKRAGQDPELAYKIRNALSPDLQRYRLSMIPNLLDKVNMNVKAGQDRFALFELGKCHVKGHLEKSSKLPVEFDRLSFVYTNKYQEDGSPYYSAKKYLDNLLSFLGIGYNLVELEDKMFNPKIPVCAPFQLKRSAGIEIAGELRGVIGEFNNEVSKNFKLPEFSAGFELDLGFLSEKFNSDPNYRPLNKFPSISQDITIEVNLESTYVEVKDNLQTKLEKNTKSSQIEFKISPVSIYQQKASRTKKITFSIEFWHPEKTLTTEEVSKILKSIS